MLDREILTLADSNLRAISGQNLSADFPERQSYSR